MPVRLNFSSAPKNADKLSYLVPDKYDARLKSFDKKTSKAGNDMFVAEWEILNLPDGQEAWPVREYYVVSEKALWKWKGLLKAANIDVEDDEDLELDESDIQDLIGLEVTLELDDDDPYVNKEGESVKKNKITKIEG